MNKFETVSTKELSDISGGGFWAAVGVGLVVGGYLWDFGCGIYDGAKGKR